MTYLWTLSGLCMHEKKNEKKKKATGFNKNVLKEIVS